MVAGENHTLILVKNNAKKEKQIYAFGHEIGIPCEKAKHTFIP